MLSHRRTASIRSWVIISTAMPRSACSLSSNWYSSALRPMSSAEKGSSSSSSCGCRSSARASATRLCMPPDSWRGNLSMSLAARPRRRARARARCCRSRRATPAALRPRAILSRVLCQGSRRGCWNMLAWLAKSLSITPSCTSSRPLHRCSRVVLPHPEGPTSAHSSPAASSKWMSSSTRVRTNSWPRPRTRRRAADEGLFMRRSPASVPLRA